MGLRVPRFVGYLLDRKQCDDRDLRVADQLNWDHSHDTGARDRFGESMSDIAPGTAWRRLRW